MHAGEAVPRVAADTPMKDVIYEMSRKGLGITTVQDGDGRLLGVITDGDLRRLMEADPDPLAHRAGGGHAPGGVTIAPGTLATGALRLLETRRITSLIVAGPDGRVAGMVHIARPLGRRAVLTGSEAGDVGAAGGLGPAGRDPCQPAATEAQ